MASRLRRPAWGVILLLAGLTLVQHYQLLAHMGSAVPSDLGDPLLNVWILWWNAHHIPLTAAYWNAPAFAPAPNALALSETLLGLTWMTSPLQWLGLAPLAAYNSAYMALPVLNGVSAYWLCLTLTARRDAAVVGALAYAFAPYHASQLPHIQTQAMFWMPIALVGLHRYWASGERRWLACFCGAMACNALTCGYFMMYFGVFVMLAAAWLATAHWNPRRVLGVLGALAAAAFVAAPIYLKYRAVQQAWGLRRPFEEVEALGADLFALVVGSDRLLFWPLHAPADLPTSALYPLYPGIVLCGLLLAGAFVGCRKRLPAPPASPGQRLAVRALFGAALLAASAAVTSLAIGGWAVELGPLHISVTQAYKPMAFALYLAALGTVATPRFSRLVRGGSLVGLYVTGAVLSLALALGPVPKALGERFWYKAPYQLLMSLPGYSSARVPALFFAVAVLCLSVLGAFAVTRLFAQPSRAAKMAVTALSAAIVVDGWALVPVAEPPPAMPPTVADSVIELPRYGPFEDAAAMYHGMAHGRPVVNGYSGYDPPHYHFLMEDIQAGCFDSLDAVRGDRSLDILVWPDARDAATLDARLAMRWGSTRDDQGRVVVYHLPRRGTLSTLPAVTTSPDLRRMCGRR